MIQFPTITVYFGSAYASGNRFTLNDPVKGVLNSATYVLAGDVGTDISQYLTDFDIRRGRPTELDDFSPGNLTANFENFERALDALNPSSPYYGNLRAGRRVTVSMYGVTLFDGRTEDWDSRWPVNAAPMTQLSAFDELHSLERREFTDWVTTPQSPTARLSAILDRPEVGFGANRNIGSSVATLQGDTVSWGSSALNYAQLVVKTEGGRLFVDRVGVLVFRGRRYLSNATPVLTFADDLTQTDFHDIETTSGSRFQVNRVGVDREGGTLQTVEDDTAQDEDGIRALSEPGLLFDTDAQSLDLANYLLSIYKDPATRVSAITINVTSLDDAKRPLVAALDIGDVVNVTWTPGATGSAVVQTLVIDGVDHSWTNDHAHIMTIRTTPAFQQAVFVLDDTVLGRADGIGRLAY